MKRFVETTEWQDPWFMDLPSKYKLLWFYIHAACNAAGIWMVNMRLAAMMVGEPLETTEVLRLFRDRVKPLGDSHWWITGFVKMQYPSGLSEDCRPHKAVIDLLREHKLPIPLGNIKQSVPAPVTSHTLPLPLANPCQRVKDKDKDKDTDKDTETDSEGGSGETAVGPYSEDFEKFWLAYPRKDGKGGAWRSWQKAKGRPKLAALIMAVAKATASAQWKRDDGQYIPLPATWLNQRRWDDEPKPAVVEKSQSKKPAGGWTREPLAHEGNGGQ